MRTVVILTGTIISRLLGRKRLIWLGLLSASPAPILLLTAYGGPELQGIQYYNDITVALGFGIVYPVVALIIATAALGEERKQDTLSFLLLKPVSRWTIALSAVVAAAVGSFLVLGAGVLATWVVGGLVGGDWSVGVATTLAIALQSLASAAIFVPLGLVLGRATLAGLGYLLVWEGILSSVIAGIQASSVYRIAISGWVDLATLTIENYETVEGVLGRVEPGLGGAAAKVAVMALVSVALTGLVLRNRDLVSG